MLGKYQKGSSVLYEIPISVKLFWITVIPFIYLCSLCSQFDATVTEFSGGETDDV